jgi:PAS domain S-box-containing protein
MANMLLFRDISIKRKLILISLFTTGVVLFLAGTVLITDEVIDSRRSMIKDLTVQAEIIGSNSTAALSFKDQKAAEEILSALRAAPDIMYAIIYTKDGKVFARYQRDGMKEDILPPLPQEDSHRFGMNHLSLFHRIVLDYNTIGTIYIQSDLKEFKSRLKRGAGITIVIMFISLCVAFLLLSKLQQTITNPILELVRVMHTISKGKDYSVRMPILSRDEMGSLTEGFNEMLAQIQDRDVELGQYQKHLEKLVVERTAELENTNKQLQQELIERKKAQDALLESEEKYRIIFENTGNATVILEEDTTISLANTEVTKLTGYPKEEIEGKSWKELMVKEDLNKLSEYHYLRRIDPDAVPGTYESKLVDRQGNVKDVLVTAAIIPGTKKSVASLLDITERKKAQEALLKSEKNYKNLVDNALVGTYKTNLKGDILYVNDAFAKILEFQSKEEMMVESVLTKYKNPKDRNILIENLKKKGRVESFETELITKTKKVKNVLLSATLDEDVISGMVIDITVRKCAEEEIKKRVRELEDFYRMAVGREMRMVELKDEIEKLNKELVKYKK